MWLEEVYKAVFEIYVTAYLLWDRDWDHTVISSAVYCALKQLNKGILSILFF